MEQGGCAAPADGGGALPACLQEGFQGTNAIMNANDAPPVHLSRTLVLVGLMGAGKTSIGRRVAARLGLEFRDADAEIESAAGQTVSEIFQTRGEAEFRRGERQVIGRLLQEPVHILATGGGAFMDAETRAAIKQHGLSLWLRADLDTLVERTSRRNTRPLLEHGDRRQILKSLMDSRYPTYALADLAVDSGHSGHEATVDVVLRAVATHLGSVSPIEKVPT
jgi:shikimate kinase